MWDRLKQVCEKHKMQPLLLCIALLVLVSGIYFFGFGNMYVQIAWLLIGFILFLKGIGIDRIALGSNSLDVEFRKIKEAKKDIDQSLHLLMPLLARIADSEFRGLLPERDRTFAYNLIKHINESEAYEACEKEKLTEDLKWVVFKWIFERLINEPLIKEVREKKKFDKFNEKIKMLEGDLKNILRTKKYTPWWLRTEIINLDSSDMDNLDETRRSEFQKIIKFYQEQIENFIRDSTLNENFFQTGKRPEE